MKTKQEQIIQKKLKPIEIGDRVAINVPYIQKSSVTEGRGKKRETKIVENSVVFHTEGTVLKILPNTEDGLVYLVQLGSVSVPSEVSIKTTWENSYKQEVFKAVHVRPTYTECGMNPFKKETFRINFYNQDITSVLFKACYGRRDYSFEKPNYDRAGNSNDTNPDKATYGGVNFNPYIIDASGKKHFFQRDLVWTLEQKQLLIDSIYNGIEIGKFLFRYRSWEHIEEGMAESGHGYSWDCVDGKQRFHAILHFVQNKFPDSFGNYWNDLSADAQGRLLNYSKLSYGEMGETAKDSDVVETFLAMNFTGTPMSPEHIAFVQSIKM